MSEREIMAAIRAIEVYLRTSETSEERTALYGARDALEIELRRVRALRPSL